MKVHKSTADLIGVLSTRGLTFRDASAAEDLLRQLNYYRFTGYSRHFQVDPRGGDDNYVAGAVFEDIVRLTQLDDEVRMRLFVVLSEIEMAVRTRFAHAAGGIFGADAFYLDIANHISDSAEAHKRITRIRDDLRDSRQPMVSHYRDGQDVSGVPIWVAIEVLSFGKVSWLVESLDSSAMRKDVASHFAYEYRTFPRMLQSLADLRNLCAHHGQIWNRNLVSQCPLPIDKRKRPLHISYHEHSLYPAVIALRSLAGTANSRTQLAAIERRLVIGDDYATGVLQPQGVR